MISIIFQNKLYKTLKNPTFLSILLDNKINQIDVFHFKKYHMYWIWLKLWIIDTAFKSILVEIKNTFE